MIPEEKIAEIRERTDIVALVQEYVPLKRVGASFKGLCPFHSEKTPSFYVHPGRQFYHCFGCKASGDPIGFLMKVEGRAFPDVVRTLAERSGIEIAEIDSAEESAQRNARQRRQRLGELMEAAAGFYIKQLTKHPLSAMARDELEARGIRQSTADAFRLGYAPHGWDLLSKWLAEQSWSPQDAEAVGLIVPRRKGAGYYDRFRHRLMFPVTDHQGTIVAFSGRQLPPPEEETLTERAEGGAKYVNSPEHPLYKKSRVLFGLHEGRVSLRRNGWALVVEGNFDLLALHQAGFQNTVAPMGTALTSEHAKLLKRFVDRVVLLFDGDKAGRKAVRASAPVLMAAGLSARVATLPPGSDPDSYVRERGADALRELVEAAPGLMAYLIDDAADEAGGDVRAKAEAIASLGPVLKELDNPVEIRLHIERIARKFGVSDLQSVRQQLRRGVRAKRGSRPARSQTPPVSSESGGQKPPERPEISPLESELVGAILDNPELFTDEGTERLEKLLTSPDLQAIFQAAARMVQVRGAVFATVLLDSFETDSVARTWLEDRLAIQKYDLDGARQVLKDGVPQLELQNIQRELPKLAERIEAARRIGDEQVALRLTRERDELSRAAHRLKQASKSNQATTG